MESGRARTFTEGIKEIFRPRSLPFSRNKSAKEIEIGINRSGDKDCFEAANKAEIVLPSKNLSNGSFDNIGLRLASSTPEIRNKINDSILSYTAINGPSVTGEKNAFNNTNGDASKGEQNSFDGGLGLIFENNEKNTRCQFCHLDLDAKKNDSRPSSGTSRNSLGSDSGYMENDNTDNHTEGIEDGIFNCSFNNSCACANYNETDENNLRRREKLKINDHNSYWNKSLLSRILKNEKNDRNDFIVLNLGIVHYLEEVFMALDINKKGYVNISDLKILCQILGKEMPNTLTNKTIICQMDTPETCLDEECILHLRFEKFRKLITENFSKSSSHLSNRTNGKLINAVVNITRRNESLNSISKLLDKIENNNIKSFGETNSIKSLTSLSGVEGGEGGCHSCHHTMTLDKNENIEFGSNKTYIENLELNKIILLQYQELQCLREVIEDLRVALQSSDAENLSLKVREEKIKRDYKSLLSLSEDNLFKEMSLTDEEDSLDRIIINLTSRERIKINSSKISSLENLTNQPPDTKDTSTTKPFISISEEAISLEEELQATYKSLSELKQELEDSRIDLENTVTEIQSKNIQINELYQILILSKKDLENSDKENNSLKEKILQNRREMDAKNNSLDLLENELRTLKTELMVKDATIETVTRDYEAIKTLRKNELEKFATVRKMVAKSMEEAVKTEASLRALLLNQSLKTSPLQERDAVTQANNHSGRKESVEDSPDQTFHFQQCWENTNLATRCERTKSERKNNSFSLSRRKQYEESSQLDDLVNEENVSTTITNKKMPGNLKSPSNSLNPSMTQRKVGSPSRTSSNHEIKPTMEVKPNVIKPITLTRHEMNQPLKIFQQIYSLNANLYENNDCNSSRIMNDAYPDESTVKAKKPPDGETFILKSPTILTKTQKAFLTTPEPYLSFGKNSNPVSDEMTLPTKYPPQTSTQILDGLEAEVELLMKSLEEDQLW